MLLNKTRLYLSRISIFMILLSLLPLQASASQITSRSLTLGSSAVGETTTHKFTFTIPSTTVVKSVQFTYCNVSTGACVTPTSLTTSGGSASSLSAGLTGFTLVNTTNGAPYLTNATGANISGVQTVTLNNIVNPTPVSSLKNVTFYVRITTYTAADASTGATDAGVVAASTANQVTISAIVPESLTFCVIAYGGLCNDTSVSTIDLGNLSTGAASSGVSQFIAGTNANGGYTVSANGNTLTSGSNTIAAYSSPTTGTAYGASGFGINLMANNTPAVTNSANVTTAAAPSLGTPASNYNTANLYKFVSADPIASATGPTNLQTFTVSYLANLSAAQAAGTYTTTLNYICTATF